MKKGVSPVIATVILLTLTILLGFIIFSSSSKFIAELSPPADCPEVVFEAGLYQENNKLFLEIDNTGNINIAGIELSADNQLGSIETTKLAAATPMGESSSKEITNFDIPQNAKIIARAQIIQNGKLVTCTNEKIIEYKIIPSSTKSLV